MRTTQRRTLMARGKNANKAANREQAVAQREAPLRNEITRLRTKLEKADLANLEQQAAHIEETRKMRLLIASNTSERLEAVESQLADVTAERDAALVYLDGVQDRWEKVSNKVLERIENEENCSRDEALSIFLSWVGAGDEGGLTIVDRDEIRAAKRYGSEGIEAIRKARRIMGDGYLRATRIT
jgi:hypothetical protein